MGKWIVEVEGEIRTRTLEVRGAEPAGEGAWVLDSAYGWTDGGQSPISAELTVKPDGYRLFLTTQANSVISAESRGKSPFRGIFSWKSGKTRQVTLERVSEDQLRSRNAALIASRMRSTIKQPAADVPAPCAGFVGGWTGEWPWYGPTWLWVVEVDARCGARFSYRSTPMIPDVFRSAVIQDGTLSIAGRNGITISLEIHGDELWARYFEPGGRDNQAVFKRFVPDQQ